jgi:hypothetical protein
VLLGALVLAAAAVLPGCALTELPELDWNPLVRVEHRSDGAVEVEALGPLVNLRSGPEGFSHAVRPFYQHKAGGPVDSTTDWLAPLGRTFTNFSGTKFRIWPLVWSGETTDTPEGTDWQAMIFPLIFTGDGPGENDGYFAFFPIAGRTRRLLGIDRFDFFLWPLFMRTHRDVTESSDSWTVLLLFGWTTGGPRDGSWRALPFYRHRLWRDPDGTLRTDERTVLWPFFTWGKDEMDSDAPGDRVAFWPFFGRETSERWSRTTVLWPFFRVNHTLPPGDVDIGREPEHFWDLPWPIFRSARSPTSTTFRIFPLYSHVTEPDLDSTAFVIPLGWWRKAHERTGEEGWPPRDVQRTDFWFIPFVHRSTRTVTGRDGEDHEFQVWPLFHDNTGARGRQDAGFPSLMPARDWDILKPADELYSCFWTLWRRRSDGATDETRLLFDTTFWRTGAQGTRISIPFLYSQRPEPGGVSEHQVLWGLFGSRSDADGLLDVTLLGMTAWRR